MNPVLFPSPISFLESISLCSFARQKLLCFFAPMSTLTSDRRGLSKRPSGSFGGDRSACPWAGFLGYRGSLLTALDLPNHSVSNHSTLFRGLICLSPRTDRLQPCLLRCAGWRRQLELRPYHSRLATMSSRIEFVILRTGRSPPVALHPVLRRRSYFQLIGPDQPMERLSRS